MKLLDLCRMNVFETFRPLYYRSLELTYTRKVKQAWNIFVFCWQFVFLETLAAVSLSRFYHIWRWKTLSFAFWRVRSSFKFCFEFQTNLSEGFCFYDGQLHKSFQFANNIIPQKATRTIFKKLDKIIVCCQARVLSYLVPAMLASVILNIPKFLEARLEEVSS